MSLTLLLELDQQVRDDLRSSAAKRVGRLLRARTVDDDDRQLGEFTDETRPTYTEVLDFIEDASQDVFITAGQASTQVFATATEPAAWVLVAIRAAMLIELSYWPQQTESSDSAYQQLSQLYEQGMRNLVTAAEDNAVTGVRFASIPLIGDTASSTASLLTAADLIA